MDRAVYENAGRVNNSNQRGECEQRGADKSALIVCRDKVEQRRGDRSDVNGKVQPTLQQQKSKIKKMGNES